jgi:CubicO group peptidase (beta-lactamase class C family)
MGGFLDNFTPSYAPGEYWVYSNQGFALLGDVLSQAYTVGSNTSSDWDETYQNWPSVVMKYLVNPLGMTSTQVAHADVADKILQGYNYTDPKDGSASYTPVSPPHWVLSSAGLGAGALSSTMQDMLLFLEQQISPPQGELGDAIRMTQQPWPSSDSLSMGLGWQRSNGYFDKDGGLGGYETYMAFDPDKKTGVFVAGNTSGGSAGGALSNAGRQLLGKIRRLPAEPSRFPHPDSMPQCPKQGATA